MCALNPKFKKRMIFDFYTSFDSPSLTQHVFEAAVLQISLDAELKINELGWLRCHAKETTQTTNATETLAAVAVKIGSLINTNKPVSPEVISELNHAVNAVMKAMHEAD